MNNFKQSNILIIGCGGTGKSTYIKKLYSELKESGRNVGLCAMTGIAAHNIGGSTLHRMMGIGIGKGNLYSKMRKVNKIAFLRKLDDLIVDEVSMFGKTLFESLNTALQMVRKNEKVFGGIRLIFSGDFLQLPPVNDEWIFKSKVWDECKFETIKLTEPFRYNDEAYFELLSRVRVGKHTKQDIETLKKRVKPVDEKALIKPTIFYSYNKDVTSYNLQMLSDLDTDLFIYNAVDGNPNNVPDTLLDEMAPSKLYMKVGAQVMLTVNLDLEQGLCNGSRGVVEECYESVVVVRFMDDTIVPITFYPFLYEDTKYTLTRSQIPLVLAWSITIHKCISGDTLLMSDKGSFPIKTLFSEKQPYGWQSPIPGNEVNVLTREGVYNKVYGLFKGKAFLYEFTTRCGYTIKISKNHVLLVNGNWTMCPKINIGDSLCIKKGIETIYKSTLHPNKAWILGCFWANEMRFKGNVNLYTPYNDENKFFTSGKSISRKVKKVINQFFEDSKVTISEYNSVIVESQDFTNFLDKYEIFPHQFPSFIFKEPTTNKRMFVSGVLSNALSYDGFKSTSLEVIKKWQLLLLDCGIFSYYSMINDENAYYYCVPCSLDPRENINCIYDEIVDKRFLGEEEDVYDINVENVHNFIGNGIVNHNSQGSTLDCALGDLGPSVFSDGQAYVMLSRVRNLEGLYLSDLSESSIKTNKEAIDFYEKVK